MKVLVTGAAGMLGGDVCRILADRHEIYATDHASGMEELDVSVPDEVFGVVRRVQPNLVIHLAAWTDVDGCERDPRRAYRVNSVGTQNVALACQERDIPLVYLSTIAVFGGDKPEPYTEFDTPAPQSVYSRSKHQGELIVQSLLRRYYIVRAGWMFGGDQRDKKFVGKIFWAARESAELRVVNDKFGSPTYTVDLARGLGRLIETDLYGVYHMVNPGGVPSRFEVASHVLDYAGITTCRLVPVSSAAFPLPAPRPRMEAGYNLHLELLGLNWMRLWTEALREYVLELVQHS
jgi:dTDP-4-dehydrorhamnose reductase